MQRGWSCHRYTPHDEGWGLGYDGRWDGLAYTSHDGRRGHEQGELIVEIFYISFFLVNPHLD